MSAPTTPSPRLPQMLVYAPAGRVTKDGQPYRRFRVRVKGQDIPLGPWGPDDSPEHQRATMKYRGICADLLRHGKVCSKPDVLTVGSLIDLYLNELARRDAAIDPPGRSEPNGRSILKKLRAGFAPERAADFSVPKLVHWRLALAETVDDRGVRLSRGYLNSKVIPTIVRMFRWAQDKGLIEGERWKGNPKDVVTPLAKGETSAPNLEAREMAEGIVVDQVLPHLLPYVRDVVQLIRLTGARPSEICRLTCAMIDTSRADVWVVDLKQNKNAHRGKMRVITFDASAQEILCRHRDPHRPYACIFTGGRLKEASVRAKHAGRNSTPTPAQLAAMAKATEDRLADAKPLDPSTVQDHVRLACVEHGIAPWTLYQLRHAAITEADDLVDEGVAQDVAGHSSAAMTKKYKHNQINRAVKARRAVTAAKAAAH